MNLCGFMNICIVGVLHKMIPPFSMFQDGRKCKIFPGVGVIIMGWRILLSLCIGKSRSLVSAREIIQENNLVLFISWFRSILIIPSINRGREGKGGYRA